MSVSLISSTLALLTILGQAIIVAGIIYYFISRKSGKSIVKDFLGAHGLILAFLVASVAMLGSLFYSEIAQYAVCRLCWYQRIFMYPQAILLGLAAWRQDKNIALYSIILSAFGALIAAYHYYIQLSGALAAVPSCSAVGYSVSCSERFIMQFGYITIPLMSLTAFLMIILIMVLQKKRLI